MLVYDIHLTKHKSSFKCLYILSITPAHTAIYTLSLHDALPICQLIRKYVRGGFITDITQPPLERIIKLSITKRMPSDDKSEDRKSTRLNSSHVAISYAVFCLKKKKYIKKT